jgi:dienelactone hydrolase
MRRRLWRALIMLSAAATAQTVSATGTAQPVGQIGQPGGTGAYPAIAESRSDAGGTTLYRPARLPKSPLPLLLWGNGGCRNNGLSASHFLRELASHGYIVIANGAPEKESPVLAALPLAIGPPAPQPGAPRVPVNRPADETSVSQMLAAIDWAGAANRRKGDPLFRHVDVTRVAALGHSCGGLQALSAGLDPRVDAVIAFNSGVYNRQGEGLSGVRITKPDLAKLHTPIAYFIGGPDDIAFPNAQDDVAQIAHVPVFMGNLPVGHGGTFGLANGGDWGRVATAWLNWQIKGDLKSARWFVGADCILCTSFGWTITRKQFPETP